MARKKPTHISAIARRNPISFASHAAKKLPAIDTPITRKNDELTRRCLAPSVQDATSGSRRMYCEFQNMNAHQAVSEQAQTMIVSTVVRRTDPRNRSVTCGVTPPADLRARCHSAGSGTERRIQNTSSAGTIPTRKT